MKLAPLQLVDYYITHLTLQANPRFQKDRPCAPPEESLQVIPSYHANTNASAQQGASEWIVSLEIQQSIPEGANLPYSFKLEIQGIVMAAPFLEGSKLQRAIHANGPAMLFGAAREIIRAATGRGPWPAMIIPSTNFLTDLPPAAPSPEITPPKKTKVAPAKKSPKAAKSKKA